MNTISETFGKFLVDTLLRDGYGNMSIENKNMLVTFIAQEDGIPLTDIDKDYIYEKQKNIKIQELAKECEESILKGFVSPNGHFYRANRDDQINMIGQKDLLDGNTSINEVMWKTEDAGYISHTREEWLKDVYYQGLSFKSNQLFRYNYLKQFIINAENERDVIGTNWSSATPFEEEIVAEDVAEVFGDKTEEVDVIAIDNLESLVNEPV